jgi:hypothetical protein
MNKYEVLDGGAAIAKEVRAVQPPLPAEEIVKQTVQAAFGRNTGWIYKTSVGCPLFIFLPSCRSMSSNESN